jgi:hypothetical protein
MARLGIWEDGRFIGRLLRDLVTANQKNPDFQILT